MRVISYLNNARSTLFSFEILPPIKGNSIKPIYDGIDRLMEFNPPFINITYHREEYIFQQNKNGQMEKIPIRKRPGTIGLCAAIKHKYRTETVPHIICGGFSRNETEDALIELNFLNIKNVLALRGDPAKDRDHFHITAGENEHASDLVNQIVSMNKGIYEGSYISDPTPTDFCIGVAGYPEKHSESSDMETDLINLKNKVDAGADYIVTQMFFDNEKFYSFVKKCREIGIKAPIIPGIKPITNKNQTLTLPNFFHISMPNELMKAVEQCKTPEAIQQVGIEWAIEQSKGLIKFGVPCIHYYTMSKTEATFNIAKKIF